MALPSVKTANPTRMTTTMPMGMMKRFISAPGDPTGHTATIGSSFRRVRIRCALYHGISDFA